MQYFVYVNNYYVHKAFSINEPNETKQHTIQKNYYFRLL